MNKTVTYGQMRELLLSLGFEDRSGEYLEFHHPEFPAAELVLALHKLDEPVLPRDIVRVRGTLDLSGVLQRDDFESWLRETKSKYP